MSGLHNLPRVLVVDCERIESVSLKEFLCNQGFDARSFTNPLDVLHATRFQSPDLVISKSEMPQLTGVELAIQVRERCPDCEVLLLAEQAAIADLLEIASASAHVFEIHSRPAQPSDLLIMIQKMMQRPRLHRPLVG